jgi:hypothetical protein
MYGVIIDATYPYMTKNKEKHLVSLKIVDPSCFLQEGDDVDAGSYGCTNVTLFAKRQEDLPLIKRIGDIIRIHRATMNIFEGKKQFVVNVFFNSSWCLFSTDLENPEENIAKTEEYREEDGENPEFKRKQVIPYKYSGKTFSVDGETLEQLQSIRAWTKKYFQENDVITDGMYTTLKL